MVLEEERIDFSWQEENRGSELLNDLPEEALSIHLYPGFELQHLWLQNLSTEPPLVISSQDLALGRGSMWRWREGTLERPNKWKKEKYIVIKRLPHTYTDVTGYVLLCLFNKGGNQGSVRLIDFPRVTKSCLCHRLCKLSGSQFPPLWDGCNDTYLTGLLGDCMSQKM